MMQQELAQGLDRLDVAVWVPFQKPKALPYQVLYRGQSPLVWAYVDCWDDLAKKLFANILRALHIPLNRCLVLGEGTTELYENSEANQTVSFGISFTKIDTRIVDSLSTIRYVEVTSLAAMLQNPLLKKQVFNELWPHRFSWN